MNNAEFRKFIANKAKAEDGSPPAARPGTSLALGGKMSSFAGMTPRPGKALGGHDFARQVREQHASLKPTKKFRSSAPKGSKFSAGYTDRAKARQEAQDDEDDKGKRIKALEEQVKLGQLEYETFEQLRDQITGGDAGATHLVKGLDRKLLERVRRGEDVLGLKDDQTETSRDVDEELEKLGEQEVERVQKETVEKRGIKAPTQVAGVKRSRDEIMAELKAQRKAAQDAKSATAPALDSRWKKIGSQAKPKIETDHKGREVLTMVDEHGVVKKKVRKLAAPEKAVTNMPDIGKPVLGADVVVPEQSKSAILEEDDDDDGDIFEGVGTEYNPLGDLDDEEVDSDDDDNDVVTAPTTAQSSSTTRRDTDSELSEESGSGDEIETSKAASTTVNTAPRNYFGDKTSTSEETAQDRFKGVENVLAKAAKLGTTAPEEDRREDETDEEHNARLAKRAKMLANQDRDLDDMDMGFGGSRMDDEEDMGDDKKIRLSEWKGVAGLDDDDGADGNKKKGKGEKKRKPKRRKGDANNMADIMKVIEGRKGGK